MNIVWVGIVAGVVGTLAMDVLNHLVSRSGAISRIDIELIGRMAAGWVRGRFSYRNPGVLGYLTHYAIGVALALIYVFGWEFLVAGPPSPAWALAYGVATTIASLFFVYPSMGFGVCGLRSPDGMKAPLSSFANHLYFGVGMAVGIALMNALG
jgi:uncharacterized membrane protein YeaQ/YmgE (transglycosylase-associated protein family)